MEKEFSVQDMVVEISGSIFHNRFIANSKQIADDSVLASGIAVSALSLPSDSNSLSVL